MGPAGRAQVTFKLAAHAAGITEKQLRNWLDKAQVSLQGDDERSEGQWRRFSLVDVVRIGIIGAIVGYGIPVTLAAEIINKRSKEAGRLPNGLPYNNNSIDERLREFGRYTVTPRQMIDMALRGAVLIISTDAGEHDVPAGTEYQVAGVRCRLGFDAEKNPSKCVNGSLSAPKPDAGDLRHFTLIDVGQIASDVLARLDADENADEDGE
jgi:hypothetical protein